MLVTYPNPASSSRKYHETRGGTRAAKAKNVGLRAKGKLKEVAGAATGDDTLRREGKTDEIEGDLKQAAEKVKDAFGR
jgi:uncharacterized protein YjbJ (UPF0337 family)